MRHRPNTFVLNQLANEVPGGAELASEARAAPPVLKVTDTQMSFMRKFDLIDHYGTLDVLKGTSIRVEPTK